MHASKFGFLLLAVVAFATPACFTVDKSDDDDGGESGDDSGGSSGKGGSGSGGTTSGSGGSSSGSGGSSSGSGGGGGSPACNLSGYQLPEASCPAGSVSYIDDPTCMDYFSCLVIVGCSAEGSDCAACVTYAEDSLSSSLMCYEGTTSGFAAACATVSQSEDSASNYPECIIDG
jgi:hypothetical protein